MAKNTHHVVRDPKGGWSVVRGGAERASKRFASKDAAIHWGQEVSRNQRTELVVHMRDGRVEWKTPMGGAPVQKE
jgi:hypothetical protein